MTHSATDLRAQVPPPDPCQRCTKVRVTGDTGLITRWRCARDLHMQDPCTEFSPLPDGRRAVPVAPFDLTANL